MELFPKIYFQQISETNIRQLERYETGATQGLNNVATQPPELCPRLTTSLLSVNIYIVIVLFANISGVSQNIHY